MKQPEGKMKHTFHEPKKGASSAQSGSRRVMFQGFDSETSVLFFGNLTWQYGFWRCKDQRTNRHKYVSQVHTCVMFNDRGYPGMLSQQKWNTLSIRMIVGSLKIHPQDYDDYDVLCPFMSQLWTGNFCLDLDGIFGMLKDCMTKPKLQSFASKLNCFNN